MKVLITIWKGFRHTASYPRMILLLLAVNLILSLLLAVPMFHSLKGSFGNSLAGERMAEGFDYLWWEEYRDEERGLAETFTPSLLGKGALLLNLEGLLHGGFWSLPPLILATGLLYMLMRTMLSGGILFIYFRCRDRFYLKDFYLGTARYAGRFLGILLGGWLFLLGIVGPASAGLNSWVRRFSQKAYSEVTPFYLSLLVDFFILILILGLQMILDYARISTVVHESRNVLKSLSSGFNFVLRHPGSTWGILFLLWLLQIVLTSVYVLLRSLIPQSHFLGVAAGFFLLQIFVTGLIWIRCWLYSSQMFLFRFHN